MTSGANVSTTEVVTVETVVNVEVGATATVVESDETSRTDSGPTATMGVSEADDDVDGVYIGG